MSKDWKRVNTRAKINIFISSRIEECAPERTAAKLAVESLNHLPILFEHKGAFSSNSRDVYLSLLDDSQFVIAIYNEGYGYIDEANGMTISGLEDEFVFAQKQSKNTLCYVKRYPQNREPRLSDLIDRIGPDFKLHFYDATDELREQIKDDLTREITALVVRAIDNNFELGFQTVLEAAEAGPFGLLGRDELLDELRTNLDQDYLVLLDGPSGSGKTTVAAQLAKEVSGIYLDAEGLGVVQLFDRCVAMLDREAGYSLQNSTVKGAQLNLARAWSETNASLLVVDNCNYISELIEAIGLGGGGAAEKKVLVIGEAPDVDIKTVQIGPISEAEASRWAMQMALDVQDIRPDSEVLIATALLQVNEFFAPPLEDGSVLQYLALVESPVSIEILSKAITGSADQVEAVYTEIEKHASFVRDEPRGVTLSNSSLREEIRTLLSASPQKLSYYSTRMSAAFEASGMLREAVKVLLQHGRQPQLRLARAALNEALKLGDWKLGEEIADNLLRAAESENRVSEIFELSLMLISPLQELGQRSRAETLIKTAEKLAPELGAKAIDELAEVQLASRARASLFRGDVQAIKETQSTYRANGDEWNAARLGIELSALLISAKEFEEAEKELRSSLEAFLLIGDGYGVELAKRNLASALSGLDGRDEELDRLLAEVGPESSEEQDTRRLEAWSCNLSTRRLRQAGRYDEAERTARRSVELAEELGDQSLKSLNLINLGNVYKDQGKSSDALRTYAEAGQIAQVCGRRDIEADSSRLSAGILNDTLESEKTFGDSKRQAREFALHAIGLLEGSIYIAALSHAFLELAEACYDLDLKLEAANAYVNAAEGFDQSNEDEFFDFALVNGSRLLLKNDPDLYMQEMARILRSDISPEMNRADQFIILLRAMPTKLGQKSLIPVISNHIGHLVSETPDVLLMPLIEIALDVAVGVDGFEEEWRKLLASLALAPLLARDPSGHLKTQFCNTLAEEVSGLDYRTTEGGTSSWAVRMDLGKPVLLTIETLDETPGTQVAGILLALFLKAFEETIAHELVAEPISDELHISLMTIAEMPEDLSKSVLDMLDGATPLEDHGVAVTRPATFEERAPTFVILSDDFLDRIALGKEIGGTHHFLFAKALQEISLQLTNGEIESESFSQVVNSIVRRTI
jgi:tetratricopeptide (TPR) repeat protein